jgi:hypothetical protein
LVLVTEEIRTVFFEEVTEVSYVFYTKVFFEGLTTQGIKLLVV